MSVEKRIKDIIWNTMNALRGVLFAKDLSFVAVRLLFLKYVVDNFIGARSVAEMQQCAMVQKMLALKDIEAGAETIEPVMAYIDKAYGLNNVLADEENLQAYNDALSISGSKGQKKTADEDNFKQVMEFIGQLDLAETDGGHSIGRALSDELIATVMDYDQRSRLRAEFSTRHELSQIARQILKVNKEDIFCDFSAGIGVSSLDITKDVMPKIIASDINPAALSLMAMFLIMYGYEDITLIVQDSIWKAGEAIHGNKIFSDMPFGMRNKAGDSKYSDSTLAAISNVVDSYLDYDGVAVLTVPGGFLFKKDKNTTAVREALIEKGLIKAVIALPPMWMSIHISTNLLVLDSREVHKDILFIDANCLGTKARNGNVSLSEEEINLIAETVNNTSTKEDFSYLADRNEILANERTLVPTRFITPIETEEDQISLKEIESELEILYSRLKHKK